MGSMKIKKKAKRFIRLLANRTKSDSSFVTKKVLRKAVRRLPDPELKEEILADFTNYLVYLKTAARKSVQRRGKIPGNEVKHHNGEDLTGSVVTRLALPDLPPLPFNLYLKKGQRVNLELGPEQHMKVYRCLLALQLGRTENYDKLLNVFQEKQDTEGYGNYDWAQQIHNLCDIAIGHLEPAILQELMKIFYRQLNNFVQQHVTKKNTNRAKHAAKKLMNILTSFHSKSSQLSENFSQPSYEDLMAAMLSVYVDLNVISARKLPDVDQKKLSKVMVASAIFLLQHQEEFLYDVLLQLTYLSVATQCLVEPLFRRALLRPKIDTYMSYTKYVATVRLAKSNISAEELQEITQVAAAVACPKGYLEWLGDQDKILLDSIPVTRNFSGVKVTRFFLNEADDDLIGDMLNLFTCDTDLAEQESDLEQVISDNEATGAEQVDIQPEQNKQKVEIEKMETEDGAISANNMTEPSELFFLDTKADPNTRAEVEKVEIEKMETEDGAISANNMAEPSELFFLDTKADPKARAEVEVLVSSSCRDDYSIHADDQQQEPVEIFVVDTDAHVRAQMELENRPGTKIEELLILESDSEVGTAAEMDVGSSVEDDKQVSGTVGETTVVQTIEGDKRKRKEEEGKVEMFEVDESSNSESELVETSNKIINMALSTQAAMLQKSCLSQRIPIGTGKTSDNAPRVDVQKPSNGSPPKEVQENVVMVTRQESSRLGAQNIRIASDTNKISSKSGSQVDLTLLQSPQMQRRPVSGNGGTKGGDNSCQEYKGDTFSDSDSNRETYDDIPQCVTLSHENLLGIHGSPKKDTTFVSPRKDASRTCQGSPAKKSEELVHMVTRRGSIRLRSLGIGNESVMAEVHSDKGNLLEGSVTRRRSALADRGSVTSTGECESNIGNDSHPGRRTSIKSPQRKSVSPKTPKERTTNPAGKIPGGSTRRDGSKTSPGSPRKEIEKRNTVTSRGSLSFAVSRTRTSSQAQSEEVYSDWSSQSDVGIPSSPRTPRQSSVTSTHKTHSDTSTGVCHTGEHNDSDSSQETHNKNTLTGTSPGNNGELVPSRGYLRTTCRFAVSSPKRHIHCVTCPESPVAGMKCNSMTIPSVKSVTALTKSATVYDFTSENDSPVKKLHNMHTRHSGKQISPKFSPKDKEDCIPRPAISQFSEAKSVHKQSPGSKSVIDRIKTSCSDSDFLTDDGILIYSQSNDNRKSVRLSPKHLPEKPTYNLRRRSTQLTPKPLPSASMPKEMADCDNLTTVTNVKRLRKRCASLPSQIESGSPDPQKRLRKGDTAAVEH